jgi:hypothetical protein
VHRIRRGLAGCRKSENEWANGKEYNPQGLKPNDFAAFTARLKPCRFKTAFRSLLLADRAVPRLQRFLNGEHEFAGVGAVDEAMVEP